MFGLRRAIDRTGVKSTTAIILKATDIQRKLNRFIASGDFLKHLITDTDGFIVGVDLSTVDPFLEKVHGMVTWSDAATDGPGLSQYIFHEWKTGRARSTAQLALFSVNGPRESLYPQFSEAGFEDLKAAGAHSKWNTRVIRAISSYGRISYEGKEYHGPRDQLLHEFCHLISAGGMSESFFAREAEKTPITRGGWFARSRYIPEHFSDFCNLLLAIVSALWADSDGSDSAEAARKKWPTLRSFLLDAENMLEQINAPKRNFRKQEIKRLVDFYCGLVEGHFEGRLF